jgi:hypothetical protein
VGAWDDRLPRRGTLATGVSIWCNVHCSFIKDNVVDSDFSNEKSQGMKILVRDVVCAVVDVCFMAGTATKLGYCVM